MGSPLVGVERRGGGSGNKSNIALALDKIHFNVLLGEGGVGQDPRLWTPHYPMSPWILYRARRPAMRLLYTSYMLNLSFTRPLCPLTVKSANAEGRSRFKFRWPDDVEASAIKVRIIN